MLCLGLGLAACSRTRPPKPFPFELSSITPAATGEVAVTAGPNGNTKLAIEVKHLAPPARVKQGAMVYVVWATELASQATAQNLGALRVDANLEGKLTTVTPLHNFDLHITPEPSPTVEVPSGPVVLKVRISRPLSGSAPFGCDSESDRQRSSRPIALAHAGSEATDQ
ncbi:MAG TPA: hypothetical protein VN253_02025 [Kofleriaceae bacterium]|nr:hypothetical protein [Kofleriaceae bacterium]